MMMLPRTVKIYVAIRPVDMRKSFDGLSIAVRNELESDPLSGHLFVFMNRSRDITKVIWWYRGGYCLFGRRLERGRFQRLIQATEDGRSVEVNGTELMMLLEGIDVGKVKMPGVWEAAGQARK